MLKEYNSLLKLKLEKEKPILIKIFKKYLESLYELYELILIDPIENYYLEIISHFICHFQIIMFTLNETVSQ